MLVPLVEELLLMVMRLFLITYFLFSLSNDSEIAGVETVLRRGRATDLERLQQFLELTHCGLLCGVHLRPAVVFDGRKATCLSLRDWSSLSSVLLPSSDAAFGEAGHPSHGVCGHFRFGPEVDLQRNQRPKWFRPWHRRVWFMAEGAKLVKDQIAI